MIVRRTVLLFALIGTGCGLDSLASPDNGTLVIRLVLGDAGTAPAAVFGHAPNASRFNNTVDTLDAARIHITGPESRTLDLPDAGDHFAGTIDDLPPGSYAVAGEGLMSEETAYYGEVGSVHVLSGQTTPVELPIFSFQPNILALDSATTALSFPLTFSSVPHADSYDVEVAPEPEFLDVTTQVALDTVIVLTVADTGSYFIRVRASNAFISVAGRASEIRRIEVVADSPAPGDHTRAAVCLNGRSTGTLVAAVGSNTSLGVRSNSRSTR